MSSSGRTSGRSSWKIRNISAVQRGEWIGAALQMNARVRAHQAAQDAVLAREGPCGFIPVGWLHRQRALLRRTIVTVTSNLMGHAGVKTAREMVHYAAL